MNKQRIIQSLYNFAGVMEMDGERMYLPSNKLVWLEVEDDTVTVCRESPYISAEWLTDQDDIIRQTFTGIDDWDILLDVWGMFVDELEKSIDD